MRFPRFLIPDGRQTPAPGACLPAGRRRLGLAIRPAPEVLEGRALLSSLHGDFDGVGHDQLAVYRPATSQWLVRGPRGDHLLGSFGGAEDVPVPADYDGVGHAELAVYRPSTSQWLVRSPAGDRVLGTFGGPGDIPVPGDYDGVGLVELAVFRPSTGQWLVRGPRGDHLIGVVAGTASTDLPAPGDYDGVGHTELAVYRPSTSQWLVRSPNGINASAFGGMGDIPVEGDYDGVGLVELAVFRPSTAQWLVRGPRGDHLLSSFGGTFLSDVPAEAHVGIVTGGGPRRGPIGPGLASVGRITLADAAADLDHGVDIADEPNGGDSISRANIDHVGDVQGYHIAGDSTIRDGAGRDIIAPIATVDLAGIGSPMVNIGNTIDVDGVPVGGVDHLTSSPSRMAVRTPRTT